MQEYDTILPGSIEVGPLPDNTYAYRIADRLSQHRYHNAASAWFDARRPQRITTEGYLVPESHWSPTVN